MGLDRKAYVFSDSNMDFLKSTVKDAPDLPATENATPPPASSKRNRAPPGESSLGATRSRGKGKGDWCSGRNSKRQCIPKVTHDRSVPIVPSAFSALSHGGPEGASLTPNANWKLSSVHSAPVFHMETSSMNSLEQGIVSNAPATAIQMHDSQIDPISPMADFHKALEQLSTGTPIPTSPGFMLQMPPVSSAISISGVELGECLKEEQMLPPTDDQGPAMQLNASLGFPTAAPSQSLKAEEDNYDFSDDEMECAEGQ